MIKIDYVAQVEDELTIAKCCRFREVEDRAKVQKTREPPNDWKHGWQFIETADGRRGFLPTCTTMTPLSSIANYVCLNQYAIDAFNERWAKLGMQGQGTSHMWRNWGTGGNAVYPEIYSEWNTESPCHDKESVCIFCKQTKPRSSFSRLQWSKRNAPNKYQALCEICVALPFVNQDEKCACVLNFEVWVMCGQCVARAAPASQRMHTDASQWATKQHILLK